MTWNAFIFFFVMPVLMVLTGYLAVMANDWAIRREDRRAAAQAANRQFPAEKLPQG